MQEEEKLSELQCYGTLKIKFNKVLFDQFWISAKWEKRVILVKALNVLLLFSASYLYEQSLSCLTVIKSKSRNRLPFVEEELHYIVHVVTNNILETKSGELMQKKNSAWSNAWNVKQAQKNIVVPDIFPKIGTRQTFYNKAFTIDNRLKTFYGKENVNIIIE